MAGSFKYFVYTSSLLNGYQHAVLFDESNTEAVNGSNYDLLDSDTTTSDQARGAVMRNVTYKGKDSTGFEHRINAQWLDPATFNTAGPLMNAVIFTRYVNGASEGVTCRVSKIEGEKLYVKLVSGDTGLVDGDFD